MNRTRTYAAAWQRPSGSPQHKQVQVGEIWHEAISIAKSQLRN
jgi:hypothetical protein